MKVNIYHFVKSVRFGVILVLIFSHFPAFGLNTEIYVFSPNAAKCGKNADQNNSECGHFLRSIYL